MGKMLRPAKLRRWLSRDGQLNIVRKGRVTFSWSDSYHWLLTLSWAKFLTLVCLLYILSNSLFASVYLLGGNCIEKARPGSFGDAFFFSIQTMATIGYGAMYPKTVYANVVVTIEVFLGLVGAAMVTGLAFARFSLPTARVLFSKVAVITPFNGAPTLMFRATNERSSLIVEAQIRVTLIQNQITREGQIMRRFYDLKLLREQTPIFALSWTVMHPIDETSPLYNLTPEILAEEEIELIVTLTGLDEMVSQTIHARHSFTAREILWNMRFVDIFSRAPDGRRLIDYTRFHDVVPVEHEIEEVNKT